MALNGSPTLSSKMLSRAQSSLRDKYPELFNTETRPGMTAADEPSVLGRFLAEEHGPLGIRLGDFVPGVAETLSARDYQALGLEAESAADPYQRAMLRGAQGLAGLGAIPMLGAITGPVTDVAGRLLTKGAGKKVLQGAERLLEQVPELGNRFGPREGFYSKLERAILEMPQAMKAPAFADYLKAKGIKQDEMDAYDIGTLIANEKKISPDMAANWAIRRRPDYTETRKAGTESTWEAAEQAGRNDDSWEPDMEAFREWRDDETLRRADEDVSNSSAIGVEEVTNDDGENVGWRTYDSNTGHSETFDTEDDAIEAMDEWRDEERDQYIRDYNDIDDDDFVSRFHRTAYNVREWADYEGYKIDTGVPPPATEEQMRYRGDVPGTPTYTEERGRWGESHYSPAARGSDWEGARKNYVELIQQMPPIAATHRRALQNEIQQGTGPALDEFEQQLQSLPLFAQPTGAQAPDWRPGEVDRIPIRATRDWNYTTHWEEPNPVEHLRGYYDVEAMTEKVRPPPTVRLPQIAGPMSRPEDALNAGYTYRIDAEDLGNGDTNYNFAVMSPDGRVIRPPTRIWTGPTAGTTGGRWSRGHTRDRDAALEEYARNQTLYAAQGDVDLYNEIAAGGGPREFEPSGQRGLFMSEVQADLEQQSKREYFPFKNPKPPTIDELRREGYEVRIRPPGGGARNIEHFYGGESLPDMDAIRGEMARLDRDPVWRDYMANAPDQEYQLNRAIMRRLSNGDIPHRESPWDMLDTLRANAERAGVDPMNIPVPPSRPPPLYTYGRPFTREEVAIDPEWENSFTNTTYGAAQPLHLPLDRPMGNSFQTPPQWEQGGALYESPQEAWDAIIAERSQAATGGNTPQFPLTDDKYQLILKRALLEAAHEGQDFVGWMTPELMMEMNRQHGSKLFPNLYKQEGYLGKGSVAKQLGLKPEPAAFDLPDPYLNKPKLEGTLMRLNEKTRKKILEEGFPLWMVPLLAAPTAGVLGYMGGGENSYD